MTATPFDLSGQTALITGAFSGLGLAAAHELAAKAAFETIASSGGLPDRRPFDAFGRDDLRRLLDVDLVAPFRLAQHAAVLMTPNSYGRIVNVSSIAGLIAQLGDAAYITAKAGINGMTRALAAELGPQGINVNAVAPGFFKTAPNAKAAADPAIAERLQMSTSLGRSRRTRPRNCVSGLPRSQLCHRPSTGGGWGLHQPLLSRACEAHHKI